MFLGFGEIMARIAPPHRLRWAQALPGAVEVTWGGGEANVCASLAILGNQARYLTALPRNALAHSLVATLRGLGVDTGSVLWRERGRLGLYFVESGANQRGSTVLYDREYSAVSLAEPDEYDFEAALSGVDWLHVTGITPAVSEPACRANLALVREARRRGATVSCDLNFRKKLWNWRSDTSPRDLARQQMTQLLPLVDVVIANEEDAADVLGIHAAGTNVAQGRLDVPAYRDVAAQICRQFENLTHVAITLRESISADHNNWGGLLYDGRAGAAVFAPVDAAGEYHPHEIRDIVDRIGAGDSFAAGLLHMLHPARQATPVQAIEFAVAASCLKHAVHGDFNYVSADEVRALAAGNASGRVQR